MKKDYIYVYDENGKKQQMELVLTVKLKDKEETYIVYKEDNKKIPLYMAKVQIKEGISSLNTHLSQQEQRILIDIIKQKLIKENYEI